MGSVSNIALPISNLICFDCRSNGDEQRPATFLPYQAASIEIESGEESSPLRVNFDVQHLKLIKNAQGVYKAYAIVTYACPGCEQVHKLEHQLEAPLVYLKHTVKCRTCGGALEVNDESIEFDDTGTAGPIVKVDLNLVCRTCVSQLRTKKEIAAPTITDLQMLGKIDINFDKGQLARHGEYAIRENRRFDVAFSFPGVKLEYVKQVATCVAAFVGRERVFFYQDYLAEMARPNLDAYLQNIYFRDAHLVAVFLCEGYENSEWCGLEWRAIRNLIKTGRTESVMMLRFDETELPGLLSIDGYINLAESNPSEAAELIKRRLELQLS
jgi:hypothetical protein